MNQLRALRHHERLLAVGSLSAALGLTAVTGCSMAPATDTPRAGDAPVAAAAHTKPHLDKGYIPLAITCPGGPVAKDVEIDDPNTALRVGGPVAVALVVNGVPKARVQMLSPQSDINLQTMSGQMLHVFPEDSLVAHQTGGDYAASTYAFDHTSEQLTLQLLQERTGINNAANPQDTDSRDAWDVRLSLACS
ncbi:MAG TPA: hypothetical protein VLF91_05675 [Candidatus Saccharimonadales bacterium]|nr:hypothetical protein [Candidatus Saccharimonadales bacterium]